MVALRIYTDRFFQHVPVETLTFHGCRGGWKCLPTAIFAMTSQSKRLLFIARVKFTELSAPMASTRRFCMEGFYLLLFCWEMVFIGSPRPHASRGRPGSTLGGLAATPFQVLAVSVYLCLCPEACLAS